MQSSSLIPSYKQGWATHGGSAVPELWRGIEGAWAPFLGITGNKLRGHSKNINHGTLNGATWGPNYLDFDGSSIVDIGDKSSLNFGVGDFSIGSEFIIDDLSTNRTLFAKQRETPSDGYWLRVTSAGKLQLVTISGGNITLVTGNTTLLTGIKYHGVGVRRGTTLSVYLNGILDNTDTGTVRDVSLASVVASIGARGEGLVNFFAGSIFNLFAWSRGLNAAEVLKHRKNSYAMFQRFVSPVGFVVPTPVGAIMNQFQGPNLGADLFNGAIM